MSIVWVVLGFIALVIGGEYLVRASVGLSIKLDISRLVIGLTVVSFATSAPELLVSLNAALSGSPAMAINNVVGSNIANIGLVLGITALISPIQVDKSFFRTNWPSLMVFSIALFYMLVNDNILSIYEGIILFTALIGFIIILIRSSTVGNADENIDGDLEVASYFKIGLWLIIGSVALYYGSEWLVDGAKTIALDFGVSEGTIGISLIAIGTSIPELAASIIAALKQEKALSLGNLIGSNIFNIGSVLGLTAIISPIAINEPQILSNDIFWMLGFAAIILLLVLLPKRYQISRIKGFLLVLLYCVFMGFVFIK